MIALDESARKIQLCANCQSVDTGCLGAISSSEPHASLSLLLKVMGYRLCTVCNGKFVLHVLIVILVKW